VGCVDSLLKAGWKCTCSVSWFLLCFTPR